MKVARDEGIMSIMLNINTARHTKTVKIFSQPRVTLEEAEGVMRQFKIDNADLTQLHGSWQPYPTWL